jgi:hypothetical protein
MTVYQHLTKSLGIVLKHFRWVHMLTDTQKAQRVSLSPQLFLGLLSIKHHGSLFIITLDESWSYLSAAQEQIWLRADEDPPERAKQTIQDKKIIVTIAWNPLGFHSVEVLRTGRGFNAEYHRDNILTELIRCRSEAG